MNPMKRKYGAAGAPYGNSTAAGGFGCANSGIEPSVIGNAGVPGCGTPTLPGTECHLKVVFKNSGDVTAESTATVEVLAGRSGAFKPRSVYMVGIGSEDPSLNARFQILDVTVMGNPQLVSYQGTTVTTDRGLTDFFNLQYAPQPVDWAVFGASAGQGLNIVIRNPDPVLTAVFYIAVWGDAASSELIGRA